MRHNFGRRMKQNMKLLCEIKIHVIVSIEQYIWNQMYYLLSHSQKFGEGVGRGWQYTYFVYPYYDLIYQIV